MSIISTEIRRFATQETAGDVTARGTDCGDGEDGLKSAGENKSEQQATVHSLFVLGRCQQV